MEKVSYTDVEFDIAKNYRGFKNALYMNKGHEFCQNLSDEQLKLLTEVMMRKLEEENREPFTVERQYFRIIKEVLEERENNVSLGGKVA